MTIHEVIQEVKLAGASRNQLRYDTMRERIYALVALEVAKLQPKEVLDVGTAYGTLAIILSMAKIKVKALDVMRLHNPKLFEKHKVEFFNQNIELQNPPKADVAVFSDVLEHLCYNPLPAMRRLRKAARGLILTTPARETDYVCKGRYKDLVNWRQIPTVDKYHYKFEDNHHHTYTRWELEDLLEEAGFTPVKFQYLPVEATWLVVAN